MHSIRKSWLSAAQGADWFRLDRHDDPDPVDPADPDPVDPQGDPDPADPEPDPDPDPTDPDPEPEGADKLGDEGKRALARMKADRAAARKEAATAKKQLADLAQKVQDFEDRDKSELDRQKARAERLTDQATKATARAVQAEVKVLAVGQFADVGDAVDVLMRDVKDYVDSDGEIDTDAIEAALADLLERKPHWAKPEPVAPEPEKKPVRQPKPDPGQGPRLPAPATDFRSAPKDEVAAELAKVGFRQRY
jgi:hypothetical protein